MYICITGSHGFVGRHFAKRLFDDGHDLILVDDLSTGLPFGQWAFPIPDVFNRMNVNYSYKEDARRFFRSGIKASQFDLIIHCAAVVGGRLKIEGDPLAVATDLAIDSDFFRWTVVDRDHLPKKVIYFSSSAVYPTMYQTRDVHFALPELLVNFDRNEIGMPDQTYGFSKLAGELLAQHAAKTYGLDVVIYRPFSGYGEDQDEVYPFPAIIRRVVNREDPICIWGSGEQQRDFIHIDDAVEAVLRSVMGLADEHGQVHALQPGEVLNLGSGVGTTFREIVLQAAEIAGHEVEQHDLKVLNATLSWGKPAIVCDKTKPEGVFSRVADVTKMRQFYSPKVSLAEGIRRSLDFMGKRM